MKKCPNCQELIGDAVSVCFNCGWNFDDPSENDKAAERERLRRKQEEERRAQEEERKKEEQRKALGKIADLNDLYEYLVLSVMDDSSGSANTYHISNMINQYAMQRWRLHSIFTNEVGKNSSSSGYGGVSSGTNATIDQTIIVLERRKEQAKVNYLCQTNRFIFLYDPAGIPQIYVG